MKIQNKNISMDGYNIDEVALVKLDLFWCGVMCKNNEIGVVRIIIMRLKVERYDSHQTLTFFNKICATRAV